MWDFYHYPWLLQIFLLAIISIYFIIFFDRMYVYIMGFELQQCLQLNVSWVSDKITNVLITNLSSGQRNTFAFLANPAPLEEDAFVAVFFRFRFRKTIRMKANVVLQDCHLLGFLLGHVIAHVSTWNLKDSKFKLMYLG